MDNEYLGANLRSKVSLDGWAYGKSERTLLRKVDHGEDDAASYVLGFAAISHGYSYCTPCFCTPVKRNF